jgi:hypothetical protein
LPKVFSLTFRTSGAVYGQWLAFVPLFKAVSYQLSAISLKPKGPLLIASFLRPAFNGSAFSSKPKIRS